jgi:hypothetical protein
MVHTAVARAPYTGARLSPAAKHKPLLFACIDAVLTNIKRCSRCLKAK